MDQAQPNLEEFTTREQQVVQFLAAGATNREIALGLTISERTVHKHLEQIYRELALSNRTRVIAALHRAVIFVRRGSLTHIRGICATWRSSQHET
ncbi:MAG: LuxR C-terminal-related transcriptional regulator [Pseudonocardiaceae bacterium]